VRGVHNPERRSDVAKLGSRERENGVGWIGETRGDVAAGATCGEKNWELVQLLGCGFWSKTKASDGTARLVEAELKANGRGEKIYVQSGRIRTPHVCREGHEQESRESATGGRRWY